MKKLLLFTTAILFTFCLNAQIVNIPDANFKAALVGNSAINTNMDTEIQVSEAIAYTGIIDVHNWNISDLTGIEEFINIIELNCGSNNLTQLNIDNNIALIELKCYNNQLTTINVSNNTALNVFYCHSNQLDSLDITNNILLTTLYCSGNLLTNLDISNNTALTNLDCSRNQLSALNVNSHTNLLMLNCGYNLLNTIDVSNNIALLSFTCDSNQLSTIDISNNLALTTFNCGYNQISTIDVTNHTNLINFYCMHNQIDSLDVSNNTALQKLFCFNNQISTLEISNNIALNKLVCFYNQLSELDISNNLLLTELSCQYNQINSLDVSNHIHLYLLYCSNNQIHHIDISNSPDLHYLRCEFNQLYSLNIQNGNNTNFSGTNFGTTGNPNLFCIQVDNPAWAINNLTYIDPHTSFGTNCLYDILNPNTISGKVVEDDNCTMNGTEQGRQGVILRTAPNNFYGITLLSGDYSITTDTGLFQVEQLGTNPLVNILCPNPSYHTIYFDSLALDTNNIDFYNEIINCPYLTIDINSDRRRRCFNNNTFVNFCNDGFADVSGVEVHVKFPDYINLVSASYPYTIDSLGNYVFDIGFLAEGDCGEIHIVDYVECINGITGLTQCTEAWITPANDCVNQLDTASYNQWDHSSVMVEGDCIGGTNIRFVITNTGAFGSGDMQQQSEYRIYRNTLLVYTGNFQLLGQEELVIDIPADGATYRLEADQHPMHPGNSHPNETIENCGNPYNTTGLVNVFPMDDEDAEIEIDCMEIVDSYDPNDKSVSPEGVTPNNFVMPGTELDFVIRFQNTGSAEAVNIVVVDTLSEFLDISTFQAGISSHPYTLDVRGHGQPVLLFQFFNINLPDSITDEPNSHGFVKFKIAPYDTLPNGTIVENTADIYFDYNVPVITNTTFVTISDTVLYGYPLVIHDSKVIISDIKIYPNPTTGKLNIIGAGIERLDINNIEGRNIYSGKQQEIDLSNQPAGIYIIKVTTNKGVNVEKIVLK